MQTKYDADDDKIKINEIDLFGLGKAYNLLIFPYLDENYSLVHKSFKYYDESSYWMLFRKSIKVFLFTPKNPHKKPVQKNNNKGKKILFLLQNKSQLIFHFYDYNRTDCRKSNLEFASSSSQLTSIHILTLLIIKMIYSYFSVSLSCLFLLFFHFIEVVRQKYEESFFSATMFVVTRQGWRRIINII